MKRFQYMIEKCRYPLSQDALDVYGAGGWELVSVVLMHDESFTAYYFKQEIVNPPQTIFTAGYSG